MPATEQGPASPFIRYRWLLDSYCKAMSNGWSDDDFISLVLRLDEAVAAVDGRGFVITPATAHPDLAAVTDLETAHLWVKNETGNVGGSHKARHLFGVLLHLSIDEPREGELAIASCGNAAIAAAVVARAVDRPLRVFIPTWAEPAVVATLEALDARIEVAERRPGEIGDPTFLRFLESIRSGSIPFSVQSTATSATLDGGRTIGWELAEQLALAHASGIIHLFVQVGGGALAASLWAGVNDGIREQWLSAGPVLHTVQTEAAAPLNRAWRQLRQTQAELDLELALDVAAADPNRFMWPWENVGESAASGILDDVTYDWYPVMKGMLASGGAALVVSEEMILRANQIGRSITGINVDPTGTAGLAALFDPAVAAHIRPEDHVVILFTGVDRSHPEPHASRLEP
ncbi:MAG TPA: PLP-dependent lyase/thiolase [Acidimicrobiia bacterium]|nr:PLP-dependent lyase/thiolase [Acidimicrobiia bacterium]